MREYKCFPKEENFTISQVIATKPLKYTAAFIKGESMSQVSKKYKELNSNKFCILPLSNTLEAEAMGASINYGLKDNLGPRAGKKISSSMEEILQLEDIDFTKGAIKEVLLAIKILKNRGERVILEVSGPFLIMDFFIEASKVYKAVRKKDQVGRRVFEKIKKNLLAYIKEAIKAGVDVISYADPPASLTVLGPSLLKNTYDIFTRDFLIELKKIASEERILIHLCPKLTQLLLAMEKVDFKEISLEAKEVISYEEAILEMACKIKDFEKTFFMGQMCINMKKSKIYSRKIKVIELLGE